MLYWRPAECTRQLPGVKIDGKRFVTSDEILELKTHLKSLLVLGAGAVGMEFASIYQRFGTACTVVEMLDRVLPLEDDDVSAEMTRMLPEARHRDHDRHKVRRRSGRW